MADTNEEQLLDGLLREIGEADRAKSTPAIEALEARVLAGWDGAAASGRTRIWKPVVVAGLAAALVMAIGGVWLSRHVPAPVVATHPAPTTSPVEHAAIVAAPPQPIPAQPPVRASIQSSLPQPSIPHHQPPIPNPQPPPSMEFLPLMPLTAQELSGPFQLVRVQVPVASLGGLTSPLQHPGELVNADVLLGEDGVARGIRIAADESNYPWRFR